MKRFQDDLGTWHDQIQETPRIVCLVPSITELLCDLGLAQWIVGRTGFCIHPHGIVQNIPKVGGTKDVNQEKIRRLRPTHLVVNIDENEKPCVDALAQFIPNIIVTHPLKPEDNLALFELLGGVFNAQDQALALSHQFEHAWNELTKRQISTEGIKRVQYCIWKDPWMTVADNTYIAAMMSTIGWQATHQGEPRYPKFEWNQALLASIDLILLSSEPYRFNESHVTELAQQTGKPVWLVDGEMMSWYGSRSIQGLRYLGDLLTRSNTQQ